ncbi:hypothetical protein T05_9029 [Trichinella murrelli]|uniref:C2H2-type domain-containing protein n=1 Tax=Trichinella murrelli TaxID=144512 RepID=A0A0V0UCK3_9BILA|nr:hypothetical protein T05_9029 [Trichinella murrelli]
MEWRCCKILRSVSSNGHANPVGGDNVTLHVQNVGTSCRMRTACGITSGRDICSKRNAVVESAWPYLLSSCAWSAHARVHGNNCSFLCLECGQELGSAEKRGRHLLIHYADRCHTPA